MAMDVTGLIRGLVCRVVGHWWGWPELRFLVEHKPQGVTVVVLRQVWRRCDRCGCLERDWERETVCIVEHAVKAAVVLDALGEKVKKAMNWE